MNRFRIALGIAGVPGTLLLTALVFLLCIAQLGPGLVMLPVTGWRFYEGDTVWGIILLILSLVVGTVDNVIRPLVYKRVSNIHPMITLVGAFAGVRYFGLLGLLMGPLAIAYLFELLRFYREEYQTPAVEPSSAEVRSA